MPDLLDMIDEIDIEVNPLVEKPIEIDDSKPPKPVTNKPVKSSKIDFNKIANKAYFQRFIQNLMKDIMPEQFKGIDFRVSKEVAIERFDNKINEIERGSKGAMRACMKELDKKLSKRKEIVENGTN